MLKSIIQTATFVGCLVLAATGQAASASPKPANAQPAQPGYDVVISIKQAGDSVGSSALNAAGLHPLFERAFRANGVAISGGAPQRLVFDGFYLIHPNLANLTVLSGALQLSRQVKVDGKDQWVAVCTDGLFDWRAGPDEYEHQLQRGVEGYVQRFVARCMSK